jgi:hypothetical protein
MAEVFVTVVPREGAKPRAFHLDADSDRGGEMIKTFRRQQARGQLLSVDVTPARVEPSPRKAAKKAAAKAVEVPAPE